MAVFKCPFYNKNNGQCECNGVFSATKHNQKDPVYDIWFDFKDKKFVPHDKVAEYIEDLKDTFPNVNVLSELKQMRLWLINHAKKAPKNYRAFMQNWLSKEADKRPQKKVSYDTPKRHLVICDRCGRKHDPDKICDCFKSEIPSSATQAKNVLGGQIIVDKKHTT